MGQDPAAIRQEIDATRDRMAGVAEALVERADVPANLRRAVDEKRAAVVAKVDDAVVQVGQTVTPEAEPGVPGATPDERRATARQRGIMVISAGAAAVTVIVVTAAVLVRRRAVERNHPERLALVARRLPDAVRDRALPAAHRVDRALDDAVEAGRARRDEAVRAMAQEVGRAIVAEQRRQDPPWRRIGRDAVGAAATTAATLTARSALRSALGDRSTAG